MELGIGFCSGADGTQIAYSNFGEGFPLVLVAGWGSSMEGDWEFLDTKGFIENVTDGRQLVLYYRRGVGASERDVEDFSMNANVADLAALVDHLGLDQFDVFAGADGTAIAAVYAESHPQRVRRMIFFSSFARGAELASVEAAQAMETMILNNWPLARRAVADVAYPNGPTELQRNYAKKLAKELSPNSAAKGLKFQHSLDVAEAVQGIKAPTLVIHRRGNRHVPVEAGRAVAALIPGASFVVIEGDNSGWYTDNQQYAEVARDFLNQGRFQSTSRAAKATTGDTHTILFTDMESSTALTQQLGDAGAQNVRHAHNDIVRAALAANSGSEIKHTGDGIMVSFSTASSALACAIVIQLGVAAHREANPDSPLGVYIGLNAGEPIAEDDPDGRVDLFGTSINLAARICDHAEPGQILASNVVRELAAGKDFLFSDIGEVVPKGFEEPVRL